MKILINERLSEHRCKTPEGYLICTDAILARTGKQTYRKNEIFKDSDDETEIEVDRTEDEVFSPQTLASFENKPVTVEHPDEDVNVHNYKEYAVGFVRDVHRGEVDGQPVILGNLVITDEQTIQEIENGEHTDLSCGYDCDIADEANPCQRNIRGNHVALCECGRAGIARIVDSVEDAQHRFEVCYINYDKYCVVIEAKSTDDAVAKFRRKYGMYHIVHVKQIDSMKNIEDNMKKYAEDKHGRTFTLEEIEGGKVKATNMSGREKIFSGWKEAEEEFRKRGITILDSFYDIVGDSAKDAKYVIMHPRKNLYLTVGAKTWSDESDPMIKKFNSEKEAEEYAKKNTSYFKIAVFDSVNDELIPPTKEAINKFEVLLRIFDIEIDRKGLTPLGRVHYQVRANMEFDRFVKTLDRIDNEMDKLGIPMTFNAGSDGKTCTAGIDLDKQYVKDSQKAQKIQNAKCIQDSKERLFTVKYKQGDTMYIHKVRASSIEDAISKVKDDDDINKLQQLIAETLSARADAWRNDKQKEIRQAKENIANAIGAEQNTRRDIKEFHTLPEYVRRIAEKEARSELKQYDYLLNIQNKIYEKYSSLMREAESLAKTIEAKYNVKLNLELNRSGGEREAIRILKTMRK